jgi:hypothetical protein
VHNVDLSISRCRNKGVVLDTGVFLLSVIGTWNPNLIDEGRIKKISSYSKSDFELLCRLTAYFSKIVITPSIITESCHHLEKVNESYGRKIFAHLAGLLRSLAESRKSSGELAQLPAFLAFGLADASVYDLSKRGFLVVTDDLPLTNYLEQGGLSVLNFTRLRTSDWLQ